MAFNSRNNIGEHDASGAATAVMLQAVPDLERAPLLLGAGDAGAVPPAAVAVAADAWRSADHYYLRSIGRIQRLWEVRACMWLREGRRQPSKNAISVCAFLEHTILTSKVEWSQDATL
jgi:hypothetical protein